MYGATNNPKYLDSAERIFKPWRDLCVDSPEHSFGRVWIGPKFLIPVVDILFQLKGRPPLGASMLLKGHVCLVEGWIGLLRRKRDSNLEELILKWVESISGDRNSGANSNIPYSNTAPASLFESNALIEVLLDIYEVLGHKEALHAAKDLAAHGLAQRTSIGLIGLEELVGAAHVDAHVDLLINLVKLSELTQDSRWLESASEILDSTIHYFKMEFGVAELVDPQSGAPLRIDIKTIGSLMS